jgi:hypothetical protein
MCVLRMRQELLSGPMPSPQRLRGLLGARLSSRSLSASGKVRLRMSEIGACQPESLGLDSLRLHSRAKAGDPNVRQLEPDLSLAPALGGPPRRRMTMVTAEVICRNLQACESQEPHRYGAE